MFSGIQKGFARFHTNIQNTASDFGDHLGKVKQNVGEKVGNGCKRVFGNFLMAASVFEAGKFAAHALPNISLIGNPLAMIAGMALVNPVLNFFSRSRAVRNSPIKNLYNRIAQTERKALDPEYQGGRKAYGGFFAKALKLATDAKNFNSENNTLKVTDIMSDPVSQRRLQGRLAAGMQKDSQGNYSSVVRLENKQGEINNHILVVYQSELKNSHARNPENIDLAKALIIIKNPQPKEREAKLILPKITDETYVPTIIRDVRIHDFHQKTVALRKNFLAGDHQIEKIVDIYRTQRAKDRAWEKKYIETMRKTALTRQDLQQDLQKATAVIGAKARTGEDGAATARLSETLAKAAQNISAFAGDTTEAALKESQKMMKQIQQQLQPKTVEQRVNQGEAIINGLNAWHGKEKPAVPATTILPVSTRATSATTSEHERPAQNKEPNDFQKLIGSYFGMPMR